MTVLRYLIHRIKGTFSELGKMRRRQRGTDHYPAYCHKCGATMIITEGFERYELEFHFDTEEHMTRSRENGF